MIGPDVAEMRKYLYSLVDWSTVQSVLDLGCGKGYDLYEIANLVPTTARLTGLDSNSNAIDLALGDPRKTDRMSFIARDIASHISFPDQEFDAVFCSNVLECIPEKTSFLQEIHRLLKPGGQFLCAHFDWDSQILNGSNKPLIRKLLHAFADWQQPWMQACDGWMGRKLWGRIQTTGLFDGQVSAYVLTNTKYESPHYGWARIEDLALLLDQGLANVSEYEELLEDVKAIAARNEYFYSITMYAYVGRALHQQR